MPAGVRQLPQFRGWPAADGAVFGESAYIDSLVLALTGFDESETGWTLFRCLSIGKSNVQIMDEK